MKQSINQSSNESLNQSINQSVSQSSNHSPIQWTNQSNNKSINLLNQSTRSMSQSHEWTKCQIYSTDGAKKRGWHTECVTHRMRSSARIAVGDDSCMQSRTAPRSDPRQMRSASMVAEHMHGIDEARPALAFTPCCKRCAENSSKPAVSSLPSPSHSRPLLTSRCSPFWRTPSDPCTKRLRWGPSCLWSSWFVLARTLGTLSKTGQASGESTSWSWSPSPSSSTPR